MPPKEKHSSPASLATPSDLLAKSKAASSDASTPSVSRPGLVKPIRDLPPPMALRLNGGELVELLADQVFADKVLIRKGEPGQAMYPSSQAASWVVHFPRVGDKFRVVPEQLLRVL